MLYYSNLFKSILLGIFDIPKDLIGPHDTFQISFANSAQIFQYFKDDQILNNAILSTINTEQILLSRADEKKDDFELVICRDYDCTKDLLYFWNNAAVYNYGMHSMSLLLTKEQFIHFSNDENFLYYIEKNCKRRTGKIKLSSYSLSHNEITELISLTGISQELWVINCLVEDIFPFSLDPSIHTITGYNHEKPSTQTIGDQLPLYNIPTLTFEN